MFSGGHRALPDRATATACSSAPGWGTIPATLAEFNLDAWDGLDFYDVSMVDGSNLPMWINITKGGTTDKISTNGCVPAGCTTPVNCPSALQVKAGGDGGRLHLRLRPVRHRPVLLPGRVGVPVGLQPGPVAGGLRRGVQEGRAVRLLLRRTTTPPASSPAPAYATTGSRSASPRAADPRLGYAVTGMITTGVVVGCAVPPAGLDRDAEPVAWQDVGRRGPGWPSPRP